MDQTETALLQILSVALAGDRVSPDALPAHTDWLALSRLAAAHKLLPLIFSALPVREIPEMQAQKNGILRQVASQTQRTEGFLALYRDMEEAGFHPLVVKGILCRSLYPQGDLRPSSDEDLFVPEEEFAGCFRFLEERGFIPTGSPENFEIGWRRGNLYIELHRCLFSPDSAWGDLNRYFAAEGTAYTVEAGSRIRSLCPHDHMLYLLLHAYKHFLYSGFGIRQICDIGLWARQYQQEIRWDLLAEQCRECRAMGFAAAVLGICDRQLQIGLALPPDWQTEDAYCLPLLEDVLTGGIYGSATDDRLHSANVTLSAVDTDRTGKRTGLLASLFPGRRSLEDRYPYLKQYPALLPLAWGQRIRRYLKGRRNPAESLTLGKERVALLRHYGIIR